MITLASSASVVLGGESVTTSFPLRPVRIIVGFPPGSSADMLARFLAAQLTDRLGQQTIVDNRAGANGIIAGELTTKAPADGHTLLLVSTSHTMNAAVQSKLPFDPAASFAPVTMLGTGPIVLVAHPSLPANNVKALVALAKTKPGVINYAVAGTGGINHFSGALFARLAGIKLTHVPYKGGAAALTNLMAGEVETMFSTLALALRQVRAGKIKALGIGNAERSPLVPDVPTIQEAGVPGYEIMIWWGMLAPAGTPATTIVRLNSELGTILKQPELARRLAADGAMPRSSTSDEFARLLVTEIEKWKRVARDSDIRAE